MAKCDRYIMRFQPLTGLGKASQGISTALSVEKTSKRGGKIVNMAAEQGKWGQGFAVGVYDCVLYCTHCRTTS